MKRNCKVKRAQPCQWIRAARPAAMGPYDARDNWPCPNDESTPQKDLRPPEYGRRLSGLKGEHEHQENNPQPAAAFLL